MDVEQKHLYCGNIPEFGIQKSVNNLINKIFKHERSDNNIINHCKCVLSKLFTDDINGALNLKKISINSKFEEKHKLNLSDDNLNKLCEGIKQIFNNFKIWKKKSKRHTGV